MVELESSRLRLRALRHDDGEFIVALLNDAAFRRYIGDRGVRTRADVEHYLANGPHRSYAQFDFGLLLVQSKTNGAALGMCGLVQRDYFPDPDLGFAFLPEYRSQGYAFEAAQTVMGDAHQRLQLKRMLAIVQPDNAASVRLLNKLGFAVERKFKLTVNDSELLVMSAHRC
jgi:RimJ/RimL family protein N-acetyltransferase